jgi:hypothetical protein
LATRRQTRRLTVYYSLLNGPTPKHIIPHLPPTVETLTPFNLRNKENLRLPRTRLQASYKSYFPKTSREWNKLPPDKKLHTSKHLFKKSISKPIVKNPYTTTHIGKQGAWIARIRMGLSGLNFHRFSYNLIDSPECTHCHNGIETTLHYLWDCTAHASAREHMINRLHSESSTGQIKRSNISQIVIFGKIQTEKLETLFNITTEFLTSTARFK